MVSYAMLVFGLLLALLAGPAAAHANPEEDLVNLDHLRFLTEIVNVDGRELALVHIYSEYPDYRWVDAAGEGLACVDDVARAAIVYLWQYERSGDPELLELARASLEFVRYMQAEDGEFYNFVWDRELNINETGGTSYKSLTWWAMRGLWALGEGVRVFDTVDPAYADELAEAYLRTEAALGATLGNYGQYTELHGFEIPAWIPFGESTVASIGLLGLAAYHEARPNPATAEIITGIADGIAAYRPGDHHLYPFKMHPARSNAPGYWHTWGAHMTHALVVAGMTLERDDWIQSAAESAESFLLRQLAFERFRHIGVVPDRLEQIAYGTNMLVLTYMALYEATGDERYARYGGLAASWYFHNNMAGVQMYHPDSGRVFDGINGPASWRVNRNAGAESTIEGLMSMIAVADAPAARDLLQVRPAGGNGYLILQAEDGQRVVGTPVYFSGDWTGQGYISGGRYVGIGEGQRMRRPFELEQTDEYLLYVAHMRQAAESDEFTIQRAQTPPVIDGSARGWPDDLPVLAADTERQFLRGAGIWRGPEVEQHTVRLLWDDDHLYLLATVRAPEHHQPYTLSTVWQADTLWIYLTSQPDARSLSAKFTLAQTPDGPQVWDWVNTRFLRGAELAWQEIDGGYIYEARVPWSSLDVTEPRAGMTIGFEAGRGLGGGSFMNLTGRDPDVASNLLQMTLVEPGMDVSALESAEVFLNVQLDDGETITMPQSVSPDSDHFWLDLVTGEPVMLEAGEHMLRYGHGASAGEHPNPGLAKVDAFYLQPVTARRLLEHPDGHMITLTYNTLSGEVTWTETGGD
jgi:hypothetical protein